MLYNLQDDYSRAKFNTRLEYLLKHAVVVELTDATKRSTAQNSYLHLLLGVVAMDLGESLEYVKQEVYKKLVNPDIYVVEKENKVLGHIAVLRSSRDLNKEEMSQSIDRFRKWAAGFGIYTPSPEDLAILQKVEVAMSQAPYL